MSDLLIQQLQIWANTGIRPCKEAIKEIQRLDAARAECARQADDDGLWFKTETASEAYLEQALRRLHAIIEGDIALNERERDEQSL